MSIELTHITKTFGTFKALDDVSLKIESGELVALLGPSGSGKTTLLRIIAGLESPDGPDANVRFADEDVTRRDVGKRQVGFVFQHYALFRHMTVFDNVAFGLTVRPRKTRPSKKEIADRVHELLRLVQLDNLARRYPSQLSGGQRQRAGQGHALAVQPKVLLLDEPFGALDAKVRKELRRWLRQLHDELHITSVFVTHDQEEALELADRVAVMNKGKIEQIGTPDEVYEHPTSEFVYNFLGNVNLFRGRVQEGRIVVGQLEGHGDADRVRAVAYVRPHDVHITRERPVGESILATVRHIHTAGPIVRVHLERIDVNDCVDAEITRERYRQLDLKTGEQVYLSLSNARVFAEDYSI
jgi:sulfate transport system ATP-binding protein